MKEKRRYLEVLMEDLLNGIVFRSFYILKISFKFSRLFGHYKIINFLLTPSHFD